MKKVTFLTCVLALCTSTMFAQTLEVTTADMDPVAAGGVVDVIEHAESGSVIEFNFDGEVLDYGEGTGIAIKGKTLTFNGINKKNGKRVTIKGLESLFTVGEASVISLNDLIIDGFKNIAIRLSGNSTLNANNCQFSNNYEPLSSKVNNGGVIRVSGSNAFLKNSLFLKNRCGASYGGGAVCAYGDSELRVENCSFVENEGAAGGAIGVNATAKNPSPRVYIANSTFENWRRANPDKKIEEFDLQLNKMSVSGALFDMVKLLDVSKIVISKMSADDVYSSSLDWAKKQDEELANLLENQKEYSLKVFGIERGNKKPRKDISKWSDVKENISYMYDELFEKDNSEYQYQVINDKDDIRRILDLYVSKYYNFEDDKQTWFDKIKELAGEMGYAKEVKEFKANPGVYKAHVGDVSTVLRVALTKRTNTPDMYEIMQVLGKDVIESRFEIAKENLK